MHGTACRCEAVHMVFLQRICRLHPFHVRMHLLVYGAAAAIAKVEVTARSPFNDAPRTPLSWPQRMCPNSVCGRFLLEMCFNKAFQFTVCGPCCKRLNCHGNVCLHVEVRRGCLPVMFSSKVPRSCEPCGAPCPGRCDFCGRAAIRSNMSWLRCWCTKLQMMMRNGCAMYENSVKNMRRL